MIAAIAGALKVNIIGHRDLVDINTIFKTLINLIKNKLFLILYEHQKSFLFQ